MDIRQTAAGYMILVITSITTSTTFQRHATTLQRRVAAPLPLQVLSIHSLTKPGGATETHSQGAYDQLDLEPMVDKKDWLNY